MLAREGGVEVGLCRYDLFKIKRATPCVAILPCFCFVVPFLKRKQKEMTETTHVYTHRPVKSREERRVYHTLAGETPDTGAVLMHGYMPIMYLACADFVL